MKTPAHPGLLSAVLAAMLLLACPTPDPSNSNPPAKGTSTAETQAEQEPSAQARDRLIARLREHPALSVQPSGAALFADGKGGEAPLVPNATRDGRDVNRRVDFLIRPLRP